MSGMKSIKISGYSALISVLLLFIRGVQSLVLNIDWIGRDISDEDVRSVAGFSHSFAGQYKGCTL